MFGMQFPAYGACPRDDLGAQPQQDHPSRSLYDRPWHVWVSLLVDTDRVPMGKTQELGHLRGVDEVISVDRGGHSPIIPDER